MAQASNSIDIARPPGEVYAFLADGLNNPKWRPAVKSISLASGKTGEVGAVYHQTLAGPGGGKVAGDYRIAEAVPGRKIRFEVVAGPARPVGVFDVEPAGAGSRVRFSLSLEPKGLMRLMGGMIQKTMEAEVANLANLKAILEAG
jgi:carbon monoxide dehydrogenase subunit G